MFTNKKVDKKATNANYCVHKWQRVWNIIRGTDAITKSKEIMTGLWFVSFNFGRILVVDQQLFVLWNLLLIGRPEILTNLTNIVKVSESLSICVYVCYSKLYKVSIRDIIST